MKKVYLFILFVLLSAQTVLGQSYQFTKVVDELYVMGVVFNSNNEMFYFDQSSGLFDETGTNLLNGGQAGHDFVCIGVENETVWVGGYGGVTKYNAGNYTSYDSIPGHPSVRMDLYDLDYYQNNVYAAIEGGGLGYFNGIEWKLYTTADGLTATVYSCVTHDDNGNIYVGGCNSNYDEGIIDVFDGSSWSNHTIADHGLEWISNLFIDSQGNLWVVGTGISMYDGSSWTTLLASLTSSHNFSGINEDLHGNIWFGNYGYADIQVYDGNQLTQVIPPQTFSGRTNSIGIDQNGELFVCLHDGVYKVEDLDGNSIISYSFTEQNAPAVIDQNNYTVDIEVVNGTNLTNLIADFSISIGATASIGAAQQQSGVTSNDFSSSVAYTIESGTGTTQDWIATVTEAPLLNNKNDILSFNIPGQIWAATINNANYTIELNVPDGTNLTNTVADFTMSSGAEVYIGGTLQESGVTANDFLSTVTYSVHAENGDIQDWFVSVTEETALSDENDILLFSFAEQNAPAVIDQNNFIVNIEVVNGTNITNLVADFTISSGAEVYVSGILQESGVTANDFTSAVTYIIEAEDGTTQNWIITSTTGIDDFSIPTSTTLNQNYPNPFNPSTMINFTVGKRSYVNLSIYNQNGQLLSIVVNGEKEPGNYTVNYEASGLSAGIYYYTLTTDNKDITKKMILIK